MYELKNGTARLVNALLSIKGDRTAIAKIAQATNYLPQQLQEDIQALYDYYTQTKADNGEE